MMGFIKVSDYVSFLESCELHPEDGLSINENKYEDFYEKIRNLYGYGDSAAENPILIRAINDAYPNEEIDKSTIQDIMNNYEMILAYKKRVDDILGKDRELTAPLLYESYKEVIMENNPRNISDLNWGQSSNPDTIMAHNPEYPSYINYQSELIKYVKDKANNNLKSGRLKFEKDIAEERIELPMQYWTELDEVKDNFIKENFEDIVLDYIEDRTVMEVALSDQAGILRHFSKDIEHDYPRFSKEARRRAVYKAYKNIEDNRIPIEDWKYIEQYVNKQMFPRELKLEKVLSLHTINEDKPKEVTYSNGNISLIRIFRPAGDTDEKDKMLIKISYNGEEFSLGNFSEENERIKIIGRVQTILGYDKNFWKEIAYKYNNYIHFRSWRKKK
ncbi:MAG: hypothetical protein NC433_01860 [Clostridiales bacterium]|nr:hypothetical protein [Clostridiales bacterium]